MKKRVKPDPGVVVMGPNGVRVPPEGAVVEWSTYWARRVKEGGLSVIEQRPAVQKKKVSNE